MKSVTIGTVVSEEKSFEIVDARRQRTTTDDNEACLYYKLPWCLRLGELKISVLMLMLLKAIRTTTMPN